MNLFMQKDGGGEVTNHTRNLPLVRVLVQRRNGH